MTLSALTFARGFAWLALVVGVAGVLGGVLLVVAYVHDRVRRFGWRRAIARLFRAHPLDRARRRSGHGTDRHRQPAPHASFTRHRLHP